MDIPDQLEEAIEDNNESTTSNEENSSEESDYDLEVVEDVDLESSSNDETEEEEDEVPHNDPGINDGRKRALGRFLLLLRGSTNISEQQITEILQMMQNVVGIYIVSALHRVEETLQERGVNLREHFDVDNEVRSTNCIFDLNNKYERAAYLKKEFKVLMPARYTLGRRFVRYGSAALGTDHPIKRKKDIMTFIPIAKTLQKFAENDSFHNILKDHNSQDGIFSSVEDGSKYRNDVWWKDHVDSMHVKLYCDEVEMCDGLGSKANGQQKLLMIYCSLTDIDPIHQPSLLYYFLLAIARSDDLKRYGMNKILKPIVEDLKKLEESVDGPGNTYIQGGLYASQGDNPAQHFMCGLKESLGRTLHPFRYCMAALPDVQIMTEERSDLLRNPENHDRQVAEIEGADDAEKEHLMTSYGINTRSVLNELQSYHVSKDAPPDIEHDFLHGLLPRGVQNFSQKVILKKMSLRKLNKLIRNFDYGYSEVDYRPSLLKAKHLVPGANMRQTGMQMTLAHMIPYIVRDIIDENCTYFYNYKNLLEISSIVFGYSISAEMVEYLKDSIAEYLEDFAILYADDDGNASFVPKQHFLIHYPRLITIFGPLRNFMCLRAEAKHQQSKRRVQGIRNYKNLPYTLAVRHQLWQTLQLLEPLTKSDITGPLKLMATETLPFYNLFPQAPLQCTTKWIIYNGVKYIAEKCLVAIDYCNIQCLPRFAALQSIIQRNAEVVFVCKKVQTVEYNAEFVAYEVIIQNDFISINPANLISHEVFHTHKSYSNLYVTVKYSFGDLY